MKATTFVAAGVLFLGVPLAYAADPCDPVADQGRAFFANIERVADHAYNTFIRKNERVAIIQGPEVRAIAGSQGGLITGSTMRAQREHPNGKVFHHSELHPGTLEGYDAVIVITHGAPNENLWYADQIGHRTDPNFQQTTKDNIITGEKLGKILKDAGFTGSRIFLDACNGGTESIDGGRGTSSAQGVANVTGARVLAARAHDHLVSDIIANNPIFTPVSDARITKDQVGFVIVDEQKQEVLGVVSEAHVGKNIADLYPPGALIVDDTAGAVVLKGELNNDIAGGTPYRLEVGHGTWAIFSPTP